MSESEEVSKSEQKFVTARFMYLTIITVTVFTITASIIIYDRLFATKIIVYDLTSKLILIEKAAKEGKITFQQAEQVSALEIEEAKRISNSAPSNCIVLSGDAVIPKTPENSGDAALGNHGSKIGK